MACRPLPYSGECNTVRAIADKVGVSYPTVWRILKKPGYVKASKKRITKAIGPGRPPIFSNEQLRLLKRMIKNELRSQLKVMVRKL